MLSKLFSVHKDKGKSIKHIKLCFGPVCFSLVTVLSDLPGNNAIPKLLLVLVILNNNRLLTHPSTSIPLSLSPFIWWYTQFKNAIFSISKTFKLNLTISKSKAGSHNCGGIDSDNKNRAWRVTTPCFKSLYSLTKHAALNFLKKIFSFRMKFFLTLYYVLLGHS